MKWYATFWIVSFFIFFSVLEARSESNSLALQLPSAPMNYQSDRFRAGDLDCSNAVGGGTTLEWGVTGVITDIGNGVGQGKDVGLYARVVIPLDKPRSRVNCDDLFQLEIRHRRLEIEMLRAELEQLKRLQETGENSDGELEFEN